ncbi:MAG: DMT family transporter [Phycisphaerales bacterium]|nr:DMT family transporter [Phycisphaerales bacterium]
MDRSPHRGSSSAVRSPARSNAPDLGPARSYALRTVARSRFTGPRAAPSYTRPRRGPGSRGAQPQALHHPPRRAHPLSPNTANTPQSAEAAAASRFTGTILILLTLLGWTSIPLFLKHFASQIDPWTANGWRYGFSAILWAPVLIVGTFHRSLPKGLWRAALVPSLFNAAAQVCFGIAPYMVGPGLMTFSMRLQIVFLTAGAALLFPAERRIIKSAGFLSGMSMVIIGTCITLALQPGGLGGGTTAGVVLSIAAGFLYAAYGLSVRHFMHGMKPFPAFAAVSQYTAAVIVILMLIYGKQSGLSALDLSTPQFALLLLSSIIGIGLGHTMYFASIARLGLAVSAGVVQLQPITVSICSFFLFGEILTPGQWSGGLIAIAGAGIMLYTQHQLARRAARASIPPAPPPSTTPASPRLAQPDEAAILCGYCGHDLEGADDGAACPQCGRAAETAPTG